MKKTLSILMIAFVLFSAVFPSSAKALDNDDGYTSIEDIPDAENTGVTINVYNWGEYISNGTEDSLDTIAEFTRETGINVNYTTFETNEALYAKLAGGGASYDVIIPSDYMISKMINENMLEELDYSKIPNYKFIDEEYKNTVFDPDNKYSVPYTWGTVGIFYNKKYVETPTSWECLWDKKYSGKILMFDNPRDAFAISMSILGFSFNTTNEDEWYQAADLLKQQKPLVQAYVMDQIFDKMESGEAWIAPYYAGDAAVLVADNPDIGFVIPESESTNFFIDSMCIPKGSAHKAEAEAFINYMCNPEISAANCGYIGYSTPISLAKSMMDEEMVNNPNYYPDKETLERCQTFTNLPDNTNELIDKLWAEVKMGGPGDTITLIIIICVFVLTYIGVVIYKKQKAKKDI